MLYIFIVLGNIYVDHAGATLYSEKQLFDIYSNLSTNLYCNPHTSKSTEDLIDQVRYKILQSFNTNSDAYSVVFTSGATASLKIIAESFDFNNETSKLEHGTFAYLQDNHTSVLGMRELVQTPNIKCITKDVLLEKNNNNLNSPKTLCDREISKSLLVFPAQCNFSGFKYPLDLIEKIQSNDFRGMENMDVPGNWYICLDAASYVSTNYLDLNKYHPDFVCISFYKLFGYPTGLGALIVSKRGEMALNKHYYGGGTVKIALSDRNWHRKRDIFHERFEDGTIPFLSIIALLSGYNTLERLVPSVKNVCTMDRISKHCFNLAKYLYLRLKNLKYDNGNAAIKFYHDTNFNSERTQGGILNFNVLNPDGSFIGFSEV